MDRRIEDYGIVGDLRTVGLIGRDGSLDWLCLPDLDSPACFAALLGDEQHGFWRVAPASGGPCTRRRYRGESLVLETEWETPEGHVRVTDLMPPRGDAADVVRIVDGLRGRVTVESLLVPRFDYGSVAPWISGADTVLAGHDPSIDIVAGPDALHLAAPVRADVADGAVLSRFEVAAGDRVPLVLTHHASHLPDPTPVDAAESLVHTLDYWADWIGQTRYDGQWQEPVRRSLITLKALTFAPTGAISAAATTSLPEQPGGPRNWDYRYCWLRDATFTLIALLGTGHTAAARSWRDWLLRAVAGDPADLQIMYGLDGRRRIPETTLEWLPGFAGSRPVRTGNGAAGQLQLDVWGETLGGLHVARAAGLTEDVDSWRLQKLLLDFLEGHWEDLDNGLWEVRGPRRPFVHSRVMAWAGVDSMVRAVENYGLDGPADEWKVLRETIRDDVLGNGYDAERNTFTQYYGSTGLDASLLLIPRVGFLPWDDPRVVGTVDAVQRELGRDGLLLRYLTHADDHVDGLPGGEGTFLVASFWLVDALYGIGRRAEARALFERLVGLRNDLGLLSEEYDVESGRQLGNFPQAFSHLGLVNSARILSGIAAPGAQAVGHTPPADVR
ncbi:glycoside hydrolase family 15 protein [Isoptericola rhizosphaerae]|uniref:glycoside hydrolase family 15 protein n=1 Tax=Isoptericola rhizosphaerae TaxID=3377837 RepID=UPI00383B54E9